MLAARIRDWAKKINRDGYIRMLHQLVTMADKPPTAPAKRGERERKNTFT